MVTPPSAPADSILAAIDVGTNSIHMVVVKIEPQIPAFTIIAREKSTVRLGDRDKINGNLTPEAIDRALKALQRCQEVAKSLQADQVIAVATSAVREAPNGTEFLQLIEAKLGLWVNLISGPEEARRIYLGVLSGLSLDDQPHVIIDIGGGSTELILGDGHEPRSLTSTKIGAVRLATSMVTTDPISPAEFLALQGYVQGMLERSLEEIRSKIKPGEVLKMIGTSGTIETLAELNARDKTGNVPAPLTGYYLSLKDIKEWVNRLRRMSYTERLTIPGMSERRAEILLPGALILQEAMSALGLDRLTVCERSLREGIVVDWMVSRGMIEDRFRYQASVRQRSVLKTAKKYRVNLEHSERVAAFALDLFDQTKPLHSLGLGARNLLWAAAILHNCGHHVSHSSHHKHSYYLIRHSELLGYTDLEIETIANLARYHRKSPPKKKHDTYRNLASKYHRRILDHLYPLLRLAVALDRRQVGGIEDVTCVLEPPVLKLYLTPTQPGDDCALELWNLGLTKVCFESHYNLQVQVILTA